MHVFAILSVISSAHIRHLQKQAAYTGSCGPGEPEPTMVSAAAGGDGALGLWAHLSGCRSTRSRCSPRLSAAPRSAWPRVGSAGWPLSPSSRRLHGPLWVAAAPGGTCRSLPEISSPCSSGDPPPWSRWLSGSSPPSPFQPSRLDSRRRRLLLRLLRLPLPGSGRLFPGSFWGSLSDVAWLPCLSVKAPGAGHGARTPRCVCVCVVAGGPEQRCETERRRRLSRRHRRHDEPRTNRLGNGFRNVSALLCLRLKNSRDVKWVKLCCRGGKRWRRLEQRADTSRHFPAVSFPTVENKDSSFWSSRGRMLEWISMARAASAPQTAHARNPVPNSIVGKKKKRSCVAAVHILHGKNGGNVQKCPTRSII